MSEGSQSETLYTTGEMAKLCNVSVRTVQFYDTKGILPPTDLTEGGRRLYTEADLGKMRLILTLKALGLSLEAIKGILDSEAPGKVLNLLLTEQERFVSDEICRRKEQLDTIKAVKDSIRDNALIPVNSISGIEHIMENRKGLKKVHGTMLVVGLVMTTINIGTVAIWVTRGIWIPFAIGVVFVVIPLGLLITRMYHRNTAYICPECSAVFRPTIWNFFSFTHTSKTRKLKCEKCGYIGYCVETFAKDIV